MLKSPRNPALALLDGTYRSPYPAPLRPSLARRPARALDALSGVPGASPSRVSPPSRARSSKINRRATSTPRAPSRAIVAPLSRRLRAVVPVRPGAQFRASARVRFL